MVQALMASKIKVTHHPHSIYTFSHHIHRLVLCTLLFPFIKSAWYLHKIFPLECLSPYPFPSLSNLKVLNLRHHLTIFSDLKRHQTHVIPHHTSIFTSQFSSELEILSLWCGHLSNTCLAWSLVLPC
jgi:hypothetical protein